MQWSPNGEVIAAVAPTVAAPLECIFEFERRLLGPHSHLLFASLLEQYAKRPCASCRQFQRKNLEESVAIVDRPVSLVKETGAVQQVAKARALETVLRHSISVAEQPQALR